MRERYRNEADLLGELSVPADALYGIHTARAIGNFPLARRPVHRALVRAYGAVKLACAETNHELGFLDDERHRALCAACAEMSEGMLDAHVVVDALQGGAGTSTNMNVNEVLANRGLQLMGRAPGDYDALSPIDDVNLHQSTNDTYPTALKVAAIRQLRELEREVVALLEEFQRKEKAMAHVVKVGRTQMQDAVLTTLGREMAAYAEAFGRDRWRIYKCEERLRVVNLGGTAVGTGLGAPREFIFRAVEHLRAITGLGLARAENLVENTQNADTFTEVSGILKACAVNLLKIATDIRALSAGPDAGIAELRIPPRQAGSSIMPGKVNPVIPEAVSQAAMQVMGNDAVIAHACSMGHLELNPFMPLIADSLLGSLDLLRNACDIFRRLCVEGLVADEERCLLSVRASTACATALLSEIGYEAAQQVAAAAAQEGRTVRDLAVERGLMSAERFDELVSAENVTRLGFPMRRSP
jgi:aspartate ammonia-lyase